MSAPTVAYDVRWRIADDAQDWTVKRFPLGVAIDIRDGLMRDTEYEGGIRSVAESGKTSQWVPFAVTVPGTNREGAAALPVNAFANQASAWDVDTSVEYVASTDGSGDSVAVITVSAGSLVVGDVSVAYAASSASVAGEPQTEKRLYLYYDDPRLLGGARTLGVAESYVDSLRGAGRVAITSVLLQFPAIGAPPNTGGGGIGGGGGGGGAHNNPQQAPL